MSRHSFHAAGFLIVRNDEGKVLLHQRAGTNFLPGYWDFPSGHLEDGESFAAAMVRELHEESSLVVREQDLEIVHLSINHIDYPYINIIFETNKWSGTPTITEPHKCTGMEFFAEDELPEKITLSVRNMQAIGFKKDLSASLFIDKARYNEIMGEPLIEL